MLGPTLALEHLGGAAGWGTIIAVEAVDAAVGGLLALRIRVSRPFVALVTSVRAIRTLGPIAAKATAGTA